MNMTSERATCSCSIVNKLEKNHQGFELRGTSEFSHILVENMNICNPLSMQMDNKEGDYIAGAV